MLENDELKRPNYLYELRFETLNKEAYVDFDTDSINNFTWELEPNKLPHVTYAPRIGLFQFTHTVFVRARCFCLGVWCVECRSVWSSWRAFWSLRRGGLLRRAVAETRARGYNPPNINIQFDLRDSPTES